MTPTRIFISGVQREFARERAQLRDYLRCDPLMRRFFEVSLFEDVQAPDRRADEALLDEVERSEIYVGLFGKHYGSEDSQGVSPTEREFDRASELEEHRLIFVGSAGGVGRHPKMQALIARAEAGLERRRFATRAELVAGLYAALLQYLEAKGLLRFGPFDAAQCSGATLDDLDVEGMYRFTRIARRARQFPLPEETEPPDLLRHLNLLNGGRLTNAAILLFGRAPQRFLVASEIKCAHFHGTQVAKPIPSYQVYRGTVFELVDQAVDFILGKIDLSVGTRSECVQAPVAYEIPREVVTEAIVNAVAHRDYTDGSSVQVMLFADRLEVMNSGGLPPGLTVEKLRAAHQSVPRNPLLAESMYLLRYIEKMGTGTVDMIRRCAEADPARAGIRGGLGVCDQDLADGPVLPRSAATLPRNPWTLPLKSALLPKKQKTLPKNQTVPTPLLPQKAVVRLGGLPENAFFAFLRSDPTLTRNGLAARLGITPDGVKYHLAKLRRAGRIRHVGPTKKGRWEILEPYDDNHDA